MNGIEFEIGKDDEPPGKKSEPIKENPRAVDGEKIANKKVQEFSASAHCS